MALILNIDTSGETAGICLSKDSEPLMIAESRDQKEHAAWLHVAIRQMMEDVGHTLADLQAIAVASGPGSYTGLRVGMAAAKGLCYALGIPFITVDTLYLMAWSIKDQLNGTSDDLICPMIDARRMEVFTALYSKEMKEVMSPSPQILDANSFGDLLPTHKIFFTGSGVDKWRNLGLSPNAYFLTTPPIAPILGRVSHHKYLIQDFTDLIYSEPAYIKEFFTHEKK